MEVANVYRATFTIGSGSATGTLDITGQGFTEFGKMVIWPPSWNIPTRATGFSGDDSLVKLDFVDVNTVRATRIGTPAEVINVEAYVVQFGADTNVYTGTYSMTTDVDTTATDNINGGSPMALGDLTKALCWSTWTSDENDDIDGNPQGNMIQTRFDSTSVIGFERGANVNNISGRWFAIESNTLTVQHLASNITAGTGDPVETAAITTVSNTAQTLVLSSFFTNQNQWIDESLWAIQLADASTLEFTRGANTVGVTVDFASQIAQDSTITVQRGEWTAASATESSALTNVDLDVAVPMIGGGHPFHVACDEYNPGNLDEFIYKAHIPDLDQIDGASTAAPGAKTLGWQVVEFTAEGAGPAPRRVMVR